MSKIKKLPLDEDFYYYMTKDLRNNNQISLYGFRVSLIYKMRRWGIRTYKDLAKFPFSKLLMSYVDVEFLGNLELQMNLHGLTLNIDVGNIPAKYNKKLNSFYEWMEEHEDLINWNDLPEFINRRNICCYKSEEDYLRDVFRGLVKEKVD